MLTSRDQAGVMRLVAILALAFLVAGWWPGTERHNVERAAARPLAFELDVNRADRGELMLLPGIGPTLADRMVDFRRRHGPLTSAEQLLAVKGIGPKTLERIRPYLRVDAPP